MFTTTLPSKPRETKMVTFPFHEKQKYERVLQLEILLKLGKQINNHDHQNRIKSQLANTSHKPDFKYAQMGEHKCRKQWW
jgi:hypothetical protein